MRYILIILVILGLGGVFELGAHQKCGRLTAWSDGSVTCDRTPTNDGRSIEGIHRPYTVMTHEWRWVN